MLHMTCYSLIMAENVQQTINISSQVEFYKVAVTDITSYVQLYAQWIYNHMHSGSFDDLCI